MTASLFLTILSFINFFGPNSEKNEWNRLSQNLKVRLAPLHQDIARASTNHPEYIETLGDRLSSEIRDFLVENSDFFVDEPPTSSSNKFLLHKNSTITQLEIIKKKLRSEAFGLEGSEEKQREFYQCIQAISELKKREKQKQ